MQQTTPSFAWIRILPAGLMLAGAAVVALAVVAGLGNLPSLSANQVSLALAGFAVLVTGLVLTLPVDVRHVGEWLLVVAGVVAVALAADVLVVNTLPAVAIKLIMMLAVFGGLLLVAAIPGTRGERTNLPATWTAAFVQNREQIARYLMLALQMGLLVAVMQQFELENQAVYHNIMLLAFFGFLVQFVLPARYRLAFFALLSVSAVLGILGIQNGLWLIMLGLLLIGVTHLPINVWVRVALLAALGILMGALRVDQLIAANPVPAAIWPILGSMFMFRLVIYLYDLEHRKESWDIWHTLSYFFMFPNVVFPFFPVVDFNTFRRTYFNAERLAIYQTGVDWILRGIFHLILYRALNYYAVIGTEDVMNTADLIRLILTTFPLYLRVSGQFHIIAGLLHLFGFNVPVTNYMYFLAAGFTDLWRRVNIYWKDFMQKIFFYPVHFRLRKLGTLPALMLSTAVVVFLTWLLHGYQWFWLRGTPYFIPTDMVFWTILGVLLLWNIYSETKFGRRRTLGTKKMTGREFFMRTLRTTATFSLLATLWLLWTSSSISAFLGLFSVIRSVTDLLLLVAAFAALMVVFAAAIWFFELRKEPQSRLAPKPQPWQWTRPAFLNVAALVALYIVSIPAVHTLPGGRVATIMSEMTANRLSARDAALLQRGYYEDLIGVDRFNADLWDLYSKRPTDWPLLQETEAATMTGDFQLIKLTPNTQIMFHGAVFSVNSYGMRDQEYDLVAPAGTQRIALLGPSYVMGSGVADNETFDALLEWQLNEQGRPTEVLNFGVAGYSVAQELWALDNMALQFNPDVIMVMAHHLEEEVLVRNMAQAFRTGVELPYPYLEELAGRAGITPGTDQAEAERLLTPFSDELLAWAYRSLVERAEENGIIPVWVFMPTPELNVSQDYRNELMTAAETAGFRILDMGDVYDGHDLETLIVAPWDRHPNAQGHLLLAQRLYEEITAGLLE